MSNTNFLTATATQAGLGDGTISLPQILKDHHKRYEQRDNDVRAWVVTRHLQLLSDAEVKQADGVEKGDHMLLRGVTIGVKDIMTTNDMPAKYGSKIYKNYNKPGLDASVVALCRQQGTIILGKTVTAEFASAGHVLSANNPVDLTRTTGYSSARSVAAVADYQCHVAIATQTIPSIIKPASFTGIFGYKPTWGSIDTNGCLSTSPSLDTIGFFARCFPDLQLLTRVCNIIPMAVPTSLPPIQGCRFGFVKTDQYEEHASDDLRQVWVLAQRILREAGAMVEETTLGPEYDNMGFAYEMCDEEAATSLLAPYRLHRADLSQGLRNMVETGGGISHLEAQCHRDHMAAFRPKFDEIVRGYSAIITPSCAGEAPKKDEFNAETRFCGMWTTLHVPVVNVSGFDGNSGLPIGLSPVRARREEEKLLQVADVVARVFVEKGKDGSL